MSLAGEEVSCGAREGGLVTWLEEGLSMESSVGWVCCRKGDSFPGLRVGSCQTLGDELSVETHVLIKQKTLLGRGTRVESSRVRQPRRTALHVACSLRFHGNGVSFRVVSGQSSCLACSWSDSGSFPVVRASLSQDGSSVMVSGRLAGHVVSSLLLSAPPKFCLLVFLSSTAFFIATS